MIDGRPRIGDEVYIHGYIDEIRKDVIIVRNEGGYFGTVPSEMFYYEEDSNGYGTMNADRPQGEWIEHKERTIVRDNNFIDFFPTEYECSNCGLREAHYFINSKPHKYCPNCGARMKGADDD